MLRLIRRILDSKFGVWLGLAFLLVIGAAFAAADLSGTLSGIGATGGGSTGGTVLTIGDREVGEAELRDRVQGGYRAASARQPELDLTSFITGGGFEATVDRVLNAVGLEEFGRSQGLVASKRLVDGRIASEPSFQGAAGFDPVAFRRILAENGMTEAQVRADLENEVLTRQLLVPVTTGAVMPPSIARRYAQLSLESRTGALAGVPASAMPRGAPPASAEVAAFYKKNIARYTVPQLRVIRIARFGKETIAAKAAPSDADIAAFYRANQDRFGPSERRSITQVTFFDQAAANAFATKVRGGQSFAAAATTAGLQPLTIADQDRAAYARSRGEPLAKAVWGAQQGAVLPPVRSQGSFTVARVDAITRRPARSLAEARSTIVEELTTERTAQLLSELDARLYERVQDGESLPDIARAEGLTLDTTPAVTASGMDPNSPSPQPVLPPQLTQRLSTLTTEDEPVIDTLVPDQLFYIADVERVVPAAPRPLAAIRERVAADLVSDRQLAQARKVADAIIARVNKGESLAAAVKASGIDLPAVQPLQANRQQLEQVRGQVPPPLTLLFAMAPNSAKRLPAPNRAGYGVVALTSVTAGDISKAEALVRSASRELSSSTGTEYGLQFARAAREAVGESRNESALNALRGSLTGAAPAQ